MKTESFIRKLNMQYAMQGLELTPIEDELNAYRLTDELYYVLHETDDGELDHAVIYADAVVKTMTAPEQILHSARTLYAIQSTLQALEFAPDQYASSIIHTISTNKTMNIELVGWNVRLKKVDGKLMVTFRKKKNNT